METNAYDVQHDDSGSLDGGGGGGGYYDDHLNFYSNYFLLF